jgi:DNA-binding NarL/FixJ family response regulator
VSRLTKLSLIVADDSPQFLQKLVAVLADEFNVVGTAADGRTALDLISRHQPDLVVLDLYMPGLNGIELTMELGRTFPSLPVVICSLETDPDIIGAARRAGAAEYVFKLRVDKDLIRTAKSAIQKRSQVLFVQ